MKNKNLYYTLITLLMLGATAMHIFHVPFATLAMLMTFCLGYLVQLWHMRQLERKLGNTQERPAQPLWSLVTVVLLLIGGTMHFYHLPFANFVLILAFVVGSWVRGRYIRQLERRAQELGLA